MPWRGRHVLVTGGTGFIGSFLVERLLDAGARVRVPVRAQNYRALSSRRSDVEWMEGDLRDAVYCRRLVEGIDEVFHLAACRRNVAYHQAHSSQVLHENLRMSLALLEALRDVPPVPVTFFSTANVPPETDTIVLARQPIVDGYTLGKALCEILWYIDARERGFPLLIARPVGVYGPRDTFTEEGNVVPALFSKCRRVRGRSETLDHVAREWMTARGMRHVLEVWGTGEEERAFLYVEDLVAALLTLKENHATGVQYVSSNRLVTIRELSEMIRDLAAPGLPIRFHPEMHLGPRTIPLLPPHLCLRTMAWTPLEEGLRRTYESWVGKGVAIG